MVQYASSMTTSLLWFRYYSRRGQLDQEERPVDAGGTGLSSREADRTMESRYRGGMGALLVIILLTDLTNDYCLITISEALVSIQFCLVPPHPSYSNCI